MIDQSPENPVLGQVVQLLNTQDVKKRKQAWSMLMGVDGWDKQKQLVLCFLDDPDQSIVDEVIKTLCEKSGESYGFYLRQYADHKNDEIRTLLLKTLISLKDPDNISVFLARISQEESALQKELAGALADFINEDLESASEAVIRVFASAHKESRKAAMSFFLKLPSKELAFKKFLSFSESIAPMIQEELFQEVTTHKDAFVEMLKEFFEKGKDPALLMQAIELAKVLKFEGIEDQLLKALSSEDWLLQQAAIKELSSMKSEKAVDVLLDLASHPELGPAAMQALDKYGDLKYAKSFFQKLPAASDAVQVELLQVLENMGDERFLPHFVKFFCSNAVKEKAKKVCYKAIVAICKRSGVEVPKEAEDEKAKMDQELLDELPDLGLKLKE